MKKCTNKFSIKKNRHTIRVFCILSISILNMNSLAVFGAPLRKCPSTEPKEFVMAFAKSVDLQKYYTKKPLMVTIQEWGECPNNICPPFKKRIKQLKSYDLILKETKLFVDIYSKNKNNISIFPRLYEHYKIDRNIAFDELQLASGLDDIYFSFNTLKNGFEVGFSGEGESPGITYRFIQDKNKCWNLSDITGFAFL